MVGFTAFPAQMMLYQVADHLLSAFAVSVAFIPFRALLAGLRFFCRCLILAFERGLGWRWALLLIVRLIAILHAADIDIVAADLFDCILKGIGAESCDLALQLLGAVIT